MKGKYLETKVTRVEISFVIIGNEWKRNKSSLIVIALKGEIYFNLTFQLILTELGECRGKFLSHEVADFN